MPQILVWQCPHTKKLFESKTKYQTHLKKLSVERFAQRKAAAFEKERNDFFAHMRATVRTPDELVEFVKQHWDKFCENAGLHNEWRMRNKKKKLAPTLVYMTIGDVGWSDYVSCTHSAPIGKKTNWGGMNKDLPTGYPGWTFKIEYNTSIANPHSYEYGSDMWKGTGVNTGTGGYASNYYYYVELFAEDWPAMRDQREKDAIWKKLKNIGSLRIYTYHIATSLNTAIGRLSR